MSQNRKMCFVVLAAVFSVCIFLSVPAYAANGLRMIGFSSRDSGMAGATTASSEDVSCLVRNPAGLVSIGNRIDLEYVSILPHDVTMDTEGPNLAALGNQPFVNRGLHQTSNIEYIPGGNGGISYRIPGTDKHPISVGVGAFTMAGVAVNYPSSRINTALTGNYDKMVDIRSMRIAPGIGVGLTDKLSFGAAANIGIQGLRSNLATVPNYFETTGGGKWSFVGGGGFTVGLLYKLNEMLNMGASYESATRMGHHSNYKDCLPIIDEPPVINFGFALKPIKNLELTYDTRYINWTSSKLAREGPGNGGFGWQDQWVFATGGEYTFKTKKNDDMLRLRLGYNYGKSQIQPNVVFANALMPVIVEHHLTMGFSYFLTKALSIDFAWEHHFKGVKVDNGSGDQYSVNGAGTKITAAAEVIGVGMGYKF